MDFIAIEKKWHNYWKENKCHKFNKDNINKKYYLLEMFSYPSGANLHLGHWWNYGVSDSFGRFKKMQGYEIFQPMGFDSFGLPAENYAIKTGIHPKDSTEKNIATMEKQLDGMDAMFDWDYQLNSHDPSYYKWTQWLFLELYKNGLAYQKTAPVNWCPSCNTVLSNEQVIAEKCERCNSEIKHKNLTQWYFKITDYAERLLEDHKKIDWPAITIHSQKNWIDKSIGGEIAFKLENSTREIRTFTSRADTLYGVTFIVVSPEYENVEQLITLEQEKSVKEYIKRAERKTELDRTSGEKTGVFTGSYVLNPLSGNKVPIFVGDYVIASYGTGAVMGVAAHDSRDYDFAKKYNLPIKRVIESKDKSELPFEEYGTLINSDKFNGLKSEEAIKEILETLENMNAGNKKTNYRLRDWSVSRQRYWGCPIPIIHCEKCGVVPVQEKDLPVTLPYNVDWSPKGTSPLASIDEYINTTCPKCNLPAKRDPDTLDTFVCSSWYYLRYPDAKNDKRPFDTKLINKMLPVDKYVGGIEHANGHLLYSRFITKFLYDKGYINFDEPFKSLVHQGLILGEDGQKMSKSKGNTVSADEIIKIYGTDILRLYLMFGFNYLEGGPWSGAGIAAMQKFTERLCRLYEKAIETTDSNGNQYGSEEKQLDYVLHSTIKSVSENFEVFSFNTAVARIMELVNALYKYDSYLNKNNKLFKESVHTLNLIIAPIMPHIAEEYFSRMVGYEQVKTIFDCSYPKYDASKIVLDEVEIAVQINNKIITKLNVSTTLNHDEITQVCLKNQKIKEVIGKQQVKKVIVIKNRLVNIIV